MHITKILKLMEKFLWKNYDPTEFSFDFPDEISAEYKSVKKENPEAAELFNELSYDCAFFNIDEVDRKYTFGIDDFRQKV